MSSDLWGIDDGYEDAWHEWKTTPDLTRAAIQKAMGVDLYSPAMPPKPPVLVVRAGQATSVSGKGELRLEDGTSLKVGRTLPSDLPLGYHELRLEKDTDSLRLIVTPGRCWLPEDLQIWGWAAQLYSVRSRESWGIGDLADLRRLASWAAKQGAGLILTNPLGAVAPTEPQESSPYSPSSRRFRNALYLRIEDIAGASALGAELEVLANAGRSLNSRDRIDRNEIFRLKYEALGKLWGRFPGDDAFDKYCRESGDSLKNFANFCVLAEEFGGDWRSWPTEFQRPDGPSVIRYSQERNDRVRFHSWVQWLLDIQLAAASQVLPLMQDLPIGMSSGGADAWAWQDILAKGISVGVAPDVYNTQGQNWGLPPFIPHRLAAAGYQPFIETIRAMLRHAGGLRIDHILGLFRLFWIPDGFHAGEGTFVRYPVHDLLGIVALESHRARAPIVGEDLGAVEPGVREMLEEHGILSYRVFWFEEEPPRTYPAKTLAAATTHDLPTIAGMWSGSDLRNQEDLGLKPDIEANQQIVDRLKEMVGLDEGATVEEAVLGVYSLLARAPSMMIAATLEDALAIRERPNMPSTIDQWPNWRLPLKHSLETLERSELAAAIAKILSERPLPASTNGQATPAHPKSAAFKPDA